MAPSKPLQIGIVIPTLNSERFISETLLSIFTQSGDFRVYLQVQDGGSKDSTLAQISKLQSQFSGDTRFEVSVLVGTDNGAYEAVSVGLRSVPGEILTWLGSDDILMPGALSTVAEIFDSNREVRWLTGLPMKINEKSQFLPSLFPIGINGFGAGFSTRRIVDVQYVGGPSPWIQQEGTFWTRDLMNESNAATAMSRRLAFDAEFWQRMALHSALVQVFSPLAAFRVRQGQLSSDRYAYDSEAMSLKRPLRGHSAPRSQTGLVLVASSTEGFQRVRPQKLWVWIYWAFHGLRKLFERW